MPTVHAENGELVFLLQQEVAEDGHHRPRRPPAVAPADGRGRGRQPRHRHRRRAGRADLHRARVAASSRPRRSRAPARAASASTARCWPATWSSTTASTATPTSRPPRPRDEPAVPAQGAPGDAVARPAVGPAAHHRDRPLHLLRAAEGRRQRRLHARSRTAAAASRSACAVIWDAGVNTGRLTPQRIRRDHVGQLREALQHLPAQGLRSSRAPTPTSWSGTRRARRRSRRRRSSRRSTSTSSRAARCAACRRHTREPGQAGLRRRRPARRDAAPGATSSGRRSAPNFEATAKRAKDLTATPVERSDAVLPLARAA